MYESVFVDEPGVFFVRILNNVSFISGSLSFPCLFNWSGHCQHFSDSCSDSTAMAFTIWLSHH